MKVRLIGECELTDRSICVGKNLTGPGVVPDGTIIEHQDAHWLIKLGKAEEIKDASGTAKASRNNPKPDTDD